MEEAPQLQGVVIITLPPADNPNKGKTITSIFTLSNSSSSSSTHQPQEQQLQDQNHLPNLSSPTSLENSSRFFSLRKISSNGLKLLLGLLSISLLASYAWKSLSSSTLFELRRPNDKHEEFSSFLFTLYPKMGSPPQRLGLDIEFKLGKVVKRESLDSMGMISVGGQVQMVDKMAEAKSSATFPVRGNIYPDGLYYVSVLVGSPPRPYFLDMDTGSDLMWIQCDAPCTSCSKGPNPLYEPSKEKMVPSKDSLCAEVQDDENPTNCKSCGQCIYEIEYADHSSSKGILVKDKLQQNILNGTMLDSHIVFGCAYDQQGELSLSPAKTDGILGLSRATISLPSQLARQGIIRNVVGHCISNDEDGLGYMFLGHDLVPQWGMTWVPMLDSPSINFYHTKITKVSHGQLSLGSHNGGTQIIFDTGSSYSYFTKEVYSGLITSLEDSLGEQLIQSNSDPTLPVCWQAKLPIRSLEDVKGFFKPLTLHFGRKWWIMSRTLQIPPEGYLILSDKGNVCLGILDGSEVHDGSTIILGDISLRGWLVVYDNLNQKIGWSRSDCAKPERYESDNYPFF